MFIGLVVVIMIISISVLAIINSYFLAFSDNFWDLNDYYSSQYAAVSAMERWWSDRAMGGTITPKRVTWSWLENGIRTGEWSFVNWNIIATGEMREFKNALPK